jgi:hypothetical protein
VCLGFSPDGRNLAVETEKGFIRLVDPHTGQEYVRLEDPTHRRVDWAAFTPGGAQLVCLSRDAGGFHIWDLHAVRLQLQELGLDWVAPHCTPLPQGGPTPALVLDVDLGDLAQLGRWSETSAKQLIAEYCKALHAQPNHAGLGNNLAWAYLMAPPPLRDAKAALPLAQKSVELVPNNCYFRNTLGLALYYNGQFQQAVATL